MANVVECRTVTANEFRQALSTRSHHFYADIADGGDTAPGPHDYFDAALAACQATTVLWYAQRNAIPLERVEVRVERDDAQERAGHYRLQVSLALHGPLTPEQRERLTVVAGKCPIHKLMTQVEIVIDTQLLPGGSTL